MNPQNPHQKDAKRILLAILLPIFSLLYTLLIHEIKFSTFKIGVASLWLKLLIDTCL